MLYGDGMLYKRPGSRFWWIQYCLRGKIFRESTKQSDYAKARRRLKQRLKEIGADQIGVKKFAGLAAERTTVSELLDALKEDLEMRHKLSAQVKSKLTPLREALGWFQAMAVDDDRIREYVSVRLYGPERVLEDAERENPSLVAQALVKTNRLRPVSNATVNRELQILSQAYKLKEREIGPGPAFPKLEERIREGFYDRADFEIIVAHLPEDLQDFARWGYFTGWRKGEIASLRWNELSMETRQLRLRGQFTKNGEPRVMLLKQELWEIIARRWQARRYEGENGETVLSQLVFFRQKGRGVPKAGVPVTEFRKSWKAACIAAEKPEALFHDFRRTAVRNMLRGGVGRKQAMEISGHKTESIFERYNISDDRDLEDAVTKTLEYVSKLPKERGNSLNDKTRN
ncbi:MAG TPA: site-specific integrase [Acidobacteriota bacterium]|nr:site-specific integrase [Acidobacteriota bacterium]